MTTKLQENRDYPKMDSDNCQGPSTRESHRTKSCSKKAVKSHAKKRQNISSHGYCDSFDNQPPRSHCQPSRKNREPT